MTTWCHRLLPDFAVPHALHCLRDQSCLLLLDGPDSSILSWGEHDSKPLYTLDDIPVVAHGHSNSPAAQGWPCPEHGGTFIQCDYELPVGPWAHTLSMQGTQALGTAWTLRFYIHWVNGTATLCAQDEPTLHEALSALSTPRPITCQPQLRDKLIPAWSQEQHRQRVSTIKELISAGDIYQANLTLPFTGTLTHGDDLDCYLTLRQQSPARYACFLRTTDKTIISHSPECYLSWRNNLLISEPIKGTRKRLRDQDNNINEILDTQQHNDLRNADKDNAELAMIIDLVRNDLNRVGSNIQVPTGPRIMDLPYVHHLLAQVHADKQAEANIQDLLAASFPAGSITGAPKIRAMQVIQELEQGPRGPYCGTFGWYGHQCGELAVAIRTMVIKGQDVRLDAGGGIVIDSDGDDEWHEVHAKASAMAHALGVHL